MFLFTAMQNVLGHEARIIRTMPNTPAMIGEGMTVWSQTSEVTEEQHELVRAFLSGLIFPCKLTTAVFLETDEAHSRCIRH